MWMAKVSTMYMVTACEYRNIWMITEVAWKRDNLQKRTGEKIKDQSMTVKKQDGVEQRWRYCTSCRLDFPARQ